jgi:membrane-bound lytic murein transglycosylase MltF
MMRRIPAVGWFWMGYLLLAGLAITSIAHADPMPRDAVRYQRDLTRNARLQWGLDAPIAAFAAQIHQESRWRIDAQSPVGAQGMAQFMPSTASWISGAYPALADNQPANPVWAMRALVTYDRYLWERIRAADKCARMAMTLSAYNGGLGWVYRDQKLAAAKTLNPAIWFFQVEKVNAGRAPAMYGENRNYPRLILLKWQSIYARWGGAIRC